MKCRVFSKPVPVEIFEKKYLIGSAAAGRNLNPASAPLMPG